MDKQRIIDCIGVIRLYCDKVEAELNKPEVVEKPDLNEFVEYQEIHDMTTRPLLMCCE